MRSPQRRSRTQSAAARACRRMPPAALGDAAQRPAASFSPRACARWSDPARRRHPGVSAHLSPSRGRPAPTPPSSNLYRIEDYLTWTLFYEPRPFTIQDVIREIQQLSMPFSETLELVKALGNSGRYLLATINNEARELNEYRI